MFVTRIKANILRLEIFLILETNQHTIKEKVTFNFDLGRFILLNMRPQGVIWVKQK
jgi:hypothetical protein